MNKLRNIDEFVVTLAVFKVMKKIFRLESS